MRFAKEDGNCTGSDEENIMILGKHFQKLYNSDVEVD